MSDCENLEEYCLMYSHLWNAIDELDDIGVGGIAYAELNDMMWKYINLVYETSKRMIENNGKCDV